MWHYGSGTADNTYHVVGHSTEFKLHLLREPMDFYEGPRGLPYEAATDANDDRLLLPGAALTVSFGTRPPQATVKGSTENNWVALFPAECPPGNFRHYHGYPNNWLADPGATAHGPWEGQLKMPDENNLSDSGKYHVRYYMADHTLIGQADVRGLSKAEFLQYCDDIDLGGRDLPALEFSSLGPFVHTVPALLTIHADTAAALQKLASKCSVGLFPSAVPTGLRREHDGAVVESTYPRVPCSFTNNNSNRIELAGTAWATSAGDYQVRAKH